MKNRFFQAVIGLSVLLLVLTGCADDDNSGSSGVSIIPTVTTTKSGSGAYNHVDFEASSDTSVNSVLQYTHELGSTPQDVYFIFTNTKTSNVTTSTTVSTQNRVEDPNGSLTGTNLNETGIGGGIPDQAEPVGLQGKPDVSAFNARSPSDNGAVIGPRLLRSTVGPSLAVAEGTSHVFMNSSTTDTVTATARKVRTVGTLTLTIWVADNSWNTGCAKAKCMTQSMVDAFADKFLQSGSNGIYDWVSSVFGAPWGSHSFSNLIPESSKDAIDILFFDIDDDGDPGDSPSTVTLGFFWSKDNYIQTTGTGSYSDASNQRLLFYMDSVLAATEDDDGSSWAISDSWPRQIVSTLAHEFQHMVHFYQKNTVYNVSSETWLNEMCSMVAEDLLADKIDADGPRGVTYNDYTAGNPGNENGRLPRFNWYDYYPVAAWSNSLSHYASKYGFGAYLARNYGGAGLFQKIVQSKYSDYQAVTNAVTAMGYSETFTTLLQKWGVAVLKSDQTGMSNGYIFNNGTLLSSAVNSITYNLGSINLFNYKFGSLTTGPHCLTPSELASFGGHYATSNTYVRVGQNQTGSFTATIDMEPGIKLTVVTRDSS